MDACEICYAVIINSILLMVRG